MLLLLVEVWWYSPDERDEEDVEARDATEESREGY